MKNRIKKIKYLETNNLEVKTLIRRKMIKGVIIGSIIGLIAAGGISVAAVTLTAKDVTYTPSDSSFKVSNTQDALNQLYNLAVNNSQSVVHLGTGTSFDLTSYTGYQNLTVEDFIIEPVVGSSSKSSKYGSVDNSNVTNIVSYAVNKTYDATTGTLTADVTVKGGHGVNSGGSFHGGSASKIVVDVNAYLISK